MVVDMSVASFLGTDANEYMRSLIFLLFLRKNLGDKELAILSRSSVLAKFLFLWEGP